MVWFLLGLLGLFLLLSVAFYQGKGFFLIAGYNTMPEKDRKAYDPKLLGQFMGRSMLAISGAIGLWVVASLLLLDWLFHVGTGLIVFIVIFMIIYANTGNRLKKG